MTDAALAGDPPGWLFSFLATYLVVWSVLGIGFFIAVVIVVVKVKRLVSRASRQVKETAEPVMNTVRDISGRVERISEVVETTVSAAARKVDAASDTFAKPVALIAAFVSGVCKGAAAGRSKRSGRPEGEGKSSG